ncbi:hypothetical protein [Sulfurimonas sp.]|uniref:hypothetical protein n=1 Tax=Sulfurimonas sp. TaxID=2022749 RepID=UPI0025EFBC13|nr:hypothetical protein [Sulfurimonas sp.]MBW6489013.1 hypothetical protein [Sulfurimonas sp.]
MTNEELSKKILSDIQYIKENSELLQKRLVDHNISTDTLNEIRSVLNKIFDNPVHSIYGDKSGDKNIGLDQLEKFASIFEKIKK